MSLDLKHCSSSEPVSLTAGVLRVLLIQQAECAFMCVWHLTSIFETFPGKPEIEWSAYSQADLTEPSVSQRAAEQARAADLVVFCLSGRVELSRSIQDWVGTWAPAKTGQESALGLLLVCHSEGPGEWEPYLRGVAERAGMDFLGVGHCAQASHSDHSPCLEA
jgi:hypothetical protein